MNNYEVKGTCMYSGVSSTRSINAESEIDAKDTATNQGLSVKTIELKNDDVTVEAPKKAEQQIVDAEELLYEMDMSGVSEITISEFTGSRTVTRDEVLAALPNDSIKK